MRKILKSDMTHEDWENVFHTAKNEGKQVWKHEDGSVMIASYTEMTEYCKDNEYSEQDPNGWTEVENV